MTFMKLNHNYINPEVNEDSEEYFDFGKYCNDFKKKNYKRVSTLIPRSDTEMIAFLEKKESVSTYIRNLIREDMEKTNK